MNKLFIVGLGPGNYENMTIKADNALKSCDVIVGYSVYINLIKDRYADKEFITSAMTCEAERCRIALDIARSGKTVAVICSGDSGIYGMSALVFELRGDSKDPQIEVVSGITAAASGSALLGAPLTHDFAVISLSDRLTPWEKIEKRLACAAMSDLSIVIYNPSSHGRPHHLKSACEILLKFLPPDRICGIVRNIGRADESRRILTLEELKNAKTDMFCTVFIGNEATKLIGENMITPRGYKNV